MTAPVKDLLRNLFTELEDDDLDVFINAARRASYPPNHVLCHENAVEESFYVILDGEVAVYKQLIEGIPKTLLEVKKAGDCFGEMALLLGEPRSADVVTQVESSFLEIDVDAFLRIANQNRIFMKHMQRLAQRYRVNHNRNRQTQTVKVTRLRTIFTSYARKDSDFVLKLVEDLQKQLAESNLILWLDQAHIGAGKEWDVEVEKALDSASAMLLVLSDDSVASKNVKSEWNYFLKQDKPIIPVMVSPCKVPMRLDSLHYIDFCNQDYMVAIARTRAALLETVK